LVLSQLNIFVLKMKWLPATVAAAVLIITNAVILVALHAAHMATLFVHSTILVVPPVRHVDQLTMIRSIIVSLLGRKN
jgi:hypothetical protein